MPVSYFVLAIAAGSVLPLQALINARLGRLLSGPLWAAAISFAVGALALIAFQLANRQPLPNLSQAAAGPPWLFVGGVLGAFYLAGATVAVPKLGAATLVSLVVLGQMIAGLLLGHFGLLADQAQPITGTKLVGAALLVAGVVLITRR